ncbi:MAG TPA: sensor domain-containing protein, partial [Streptosporangiaceae bacterium]|nr:sensor domain-containing protein [Streptosporangiaceae bacterium]
MSTAGPENPAAAGRPSGHGPAEPDAPGTAGGSPAALALGIASAPFTGRAWRELLFCAIEVPLGLCVLVVPIALTALPAAVTVLLYGSPALARPAPAYSAGLVPAFGGVVIAVLLALILLAPRTGRGLGAVHRRLAARLLGERIAAPPPIHRGRGVGVWFGATVRDGPGWRAAAYLLVKLPVTVGELYAAFFAAAGLANLTYPLWWPLFRNHPPDVRLGPVYALTPFGALRIETFPGTFAAFAAGAAMVLAAPWAARAVSSADRWLMRGLLGPGRLAQRVADLEQSRALAVDDSAATLRRLERDLHDGAQIRLATLAMNLGMAREKLGDDASPEARELVDAAHQGAKDALIDLRNLARGIHPPALDNGLADALATLAASSAIPAELTTAIPERPAPAIETIAYFCAAELLANAAKHSYANRVTIEVAERGQMLVLRVGDDGRGGADPARGSGLSGLTQRVRTVDGRLEIASPSGGPT